MKTMIPQVKGVAAINGKQARRTGDEKKRPLHVVSAFSQEYGLVSLHAKKKQRNNSNIKTSRNT
ncbi:MAG: hypothetical protein K2G88_05405 [Oscillospiraceae bacterium]|nr:hypothetical protein [Oscillospiraceae bacterium]